MTYFKLWLIQWQFHRRQVEQTPSSYFFFLTMKVYFNADLHVSVNEMFCPWSKKARNKEQENRDFQVELSHRSLG